ncbi:MAG: vWA domain-containing protein, partial [Aureliella sp.]
MLAKHLCVLLATLVVPVLGASAGQPSIGGTSRWATFDATDSGYFAVSVQPDASGAVPLPERHEIVLLVDTSASQTGVVRLDALEAIDELLTDLPASASVGLVACDITSVVLTKALAAPGSPELAAAVERLKNRVPLGTTNLALGLRTALAQFG